MDEHETLVRWVETWKEAGPRLEAIRGREIREADNLKVLPPRPSSGLVEMQQWLAKLGR
jgi:hypothetical protein